MRRYFDFWTGRPRAEPNEDEILELFRVSANNALEDSWNEKDPSITYQWIPQFSFYAAESAFPGTVNLTVQERIGATGDVSMRISTFKIEKLRSQVFDQPSL